MIDAIEPPKSDNRILYSAGHNFKYRLLDQHKHVTALRPSQELVVGDRWLSLAEDGVLLFRAGYAWDGPSGPTIDTSNWMRASLVHDGLYQLGREGLLWHTRIEGEDDLDHRKYADALMRSIAVEDGMSRLRAWYSYVGVRLFAAKHARERPLPDVLIAP